MRIYGVLGHARKHINSLFLNLHRKKVNFRWVLYLIKQIKNWAEVHLNKTNALLKKMSSKKLLISSLYFLSRINYETVDESVLHRMIYHIRNKIPFNYHFFGKPVPYSYDLLKDVEDLHREGYIDIIIQVIDESVPRYTL